jgi:alcohol dehydrogenase (NADP+)
VAVVGIGGLGHLGVQWARALGAEVAALSHQEAKRADAEKLGANEFIITSNLEEVTKKYERKFDFVLVCNDMSSFANDFHDLPVTDDSFGYRWRPC